MMKLESICLNSECDVYDSCDKMMNTNFARELMKQCTVHKEYHKVIHFDLRSVRHSITPLACIDSVNCLS